jgi:peroxiredoxin Q/BCP
MITLNAAAPSFEALATDGKTVRLADYKGKPLVLYFFPRAFTPGCTREANNFEESLPEITALGARVVGVSTDDHKTQCEFSEARNLSFPILTDGTGDIARSYDVIWPLMKIAQRVTFIVDGDGIIRAIFHHEIRVGQHVKSVLQALKTLKS